jgi:large subunit ribosomal protein L17
MRHGIAGNRLSRNQTLRWATVRDLAKATLIAQSIQTTQARAKEARKLVEKLITLGKSGSLSAKRKAFSILCDHRLVSELFKDTAPLFNSRIGGYTRIIKLGPRRGDNAQMVILELTEKKIIVEPVKKEKTKGEPKAKASTTKEEKKHGVKDAQKEQTTTKKDAVKAEGKDQITHQPDQAKPSKPLSGIRKMFNRKAPGQ